MKRKSSLLLLLAGFSALLSFRMPDLLWKVDAEHASVAWNMPNKGHSGTFSGLEAEIEFDPTDIAASRIKARIATETVTSDDPELTAHIKAPDFFHTEKYPTISFTSRSFTPLSSENIQISGDLQIRETVKTIEFPFTFTPTENGAVFRGSMKIFGRDFGIMKPSETDKDLVVVNLEVPVVRK